MDFENLFENAECERAILRIAGGDKEALKVIYERMNRKIYAVAYSILRDFATADDVTQETYVKIMENAFSYRKGTNARSWILSIARNLSIDIFRHRRLEFSVEEAKQDEVSHEEGRFDEGEVLASMEVKRALDILDPEERQIVTLRVYAGLRHREIGGLLGITEENTKKKYQRATAKMRDFLERKEAK